LPIFFRVGTLSVGQIVHELDISRPCVPDITNFLSKVWRYVWK